MIGLEIRLEQQRKCGLIIVVLTLFSLSMGAAVSAIMRRIKHSDPLIQLQALTVRGYS